MLNINTDELIWSDEIYRIFGLLPGFKNTYEAFLKVVHPEDRQYVRENMDSALKHKKTYDINHRIVKPDGSKRVVHEIGKVVLDRNNMPIRMLGTIHDITEQFATAQKLQEYTKKLEEKVNERTIELRSINAVLEAAKEAAEAANLAKSAFLANMSHEIRTPMNAIIGMTHLTLLTELTLKQQDYLSKIQTAANSLLNILNDILDFSKIEAGRLQMDSVDFYLAETLNNVVDLIIVKSRQKELPFLLAIPPNLPLALIGDPLRLSQILINLANNAVKFTDQGEIVLAVELLKEEGGKGGRPCVSASAIPASV